MNYRLGFLLKGESKRYTENLIKDVAKRFNVNYVYKGGKGNPAHITLKYRFGTDNVKKIEKVIWDICQKTKTSYFEMGGIGSFNKDTLHLKVKPSKEMVKFERELLKQLSNFKGDLYKFDRVLYKNLHVSIANHDIGEKFYEIKDYLEKHSKKFKLKFDKIYLIKKPKNKWVVHKEFKLK